MLKRKFPRLSISSLDTVHNLTTSSREFKTYKQEDIEVNNKWLFIALMRGILSGPLDMFFWSAEKNVFIEEMKGTYSVVIAINKGKRLKYRFVRRKLDSRLILMKKIPVL